MHLYIESVENEYKNQNNTSNHSDDQLLSTLQNQLSVYTNECTSLKQQLSNYKTKQDAFKSQLLVQNKNEEVLREQLVVYQQQQQQQQQHGSQAGDGSSSNAQQKQQRLAVENAELHRKVQELQDHLDEQSNQTSSSAALSQYPAELEKEMQERLAKR